MSGDSTYFQDGEYMPIRDDLKRTDESILPTSPIIGWSKLSRNKIVNNDANKRFAHKWKNPIHSKL